MRQLLFCWVTGIALTLCLSVALAGPAPDLAALEKSGCAAYRSTEVAIPACTAAIERWPDLAAAYAIRGNAYRVRDSYQNALADFDKSLELEPDNGFAVARRAIFYYDTRNRGLSMDERRKLIHSTPTDARGFEARALIFMDFNRFDAAIEDIAQGLKLAPDDLLLHATRAEILLKKREFEASLAEFDIVIAAAPDASMQHFKRAEALRGLYRYRETMESYSKAADLDPQVLNFKYGKRQEEARQAPLAGATSVAPIRMAGAPPAEQQFAPPLVEKATSPPSVVSPDDTYESPFARYSNAPQGGDFTGGGGQIAAMSAFLQAVKQLDARDYRAAVVSLDAAIALQPGLTEALMARAFARLHLRELKEARGDLDSVLALAPRDVKALAMRGEVKVRAGDLDGGLADLQRALSIEPQNVLARETRGWVYLRKENNSAARRDFGSVLAANPSSRPARLGMAELHIQSGDREAAKGLYRQILAENPNLAEAREGLDRASAPARGRLAGIHHSSIRIAVVRSAQPGCSRDCPEWISAEGVIDEDASSRFKAVLKGLGARKLPVFISSSGGENSAGFEFGRLVRAHGLDVYVTRTEIIPCKGTKADCAKQPLQGIPAAEDAHCESACVSILAAGVRRGVGPSAVVGVHPATLYLMRGRKGGRMKIVGVTGATKASNKELERYFTSTGIAPAIMTLVKSTPRQGMYWLSREDLRSTRVMTEEMDGEQLIAQSTQPSWTVAEQRAAATAARDSFGAELQSSATDHTKSAKRWLWVSQTPPDKRP